MSQGLRDLTIALCGPALRSPARAGIEEGKRSSSQLLVDAALDLEIMRQFHSRRCEPPLSHCLGDGKILVDDMRSASDHRARVPKAGGRLARLRRTIHHARARPACQHRGPNRSLQIDRNVIARCANVIPDFRDLLQSRNREQRFPPSSQTHGVHPIRQRPLRRSRPAPRRSGRAQKFGPSFFDQPADHRAGKCLTQSLCGGQRVDDIAHCAQADDEQAVDVCSAFCRHDQDFLGESRERMISLVE